MTIGICPEKTFDHASLSNEETKDVKKVFDEIEKKFNEARGAKLRYNS